MSARRLLQISAILMLLGAVLHTIGNLSPPTDPRLIKLEEAMNGYTFDAGMSMHPSLRDVHMTLVLTMSITFAALGILNLVLASAAIPDALLRRIIRINAAWVAASIALCIYYKVPPPLISGVVIEIPLIAAMFKSSSS
jgi:hypothetical protein